MDGFKQRKQGALGRNSKWGRRMPILCIGLLIVITAAIWSGTRMAPSMAEYQKKLAALEACVLSEEIQDAVGKDPAGEQAGYAVFLSVCDTTQRASVFCGMGDSLRSAWDDAGGQAEKFLEDSGYDPVWVKADVVCASSVIKRVDIEHKVRTSRHESCRIGLAFDPGFGTALLEAELNGAKIYDYENGGIDLQYLNQYLKKVGRGTLTHLPDTFTAFRCMGWFCGEDGEVHELSADGLDYGRRKEKVDDVVAKELIMSASAFLKKQLKEDGSFVYGMYPRFDNEIDNYNIVRHASTLWSLICRYRLSPEDELREEIERAIGFLLGNVVYNAEGRAYLYEEKSNEIKLGGCGIAVVALTEYMDVFQDDRYEEECLALGEGILSLLDQETGEWYHVLSGDFFRKEAYRTVYYDGEATFALCRLYGLTKDPKYLDAARRSVDHFIEADYTQYRDHWVAYSMNEITKYVDDERYCRFALANAQENLQIIREQKTTYHTYLELLMATFEVYDRMAQNGMDVEGFDLQGLLDTIYVRAGRQLDGYFFPEYAMYMKNPGRILDTFMVRHDGYRVRIDDVQHNIGGYYLYFKNYEKLIGYGMTVE